jgi:hypothetical protein
LTPTQKTQEKILKIQIDTPHKKGFFMKLEIAIPHTVKQYLVDTLSACNAAKKLQFVEMSQVVGHEPKLLKPIYDTHLDGVLLTDESIKPLYRLDGALTSSEEQLQMLKSLDQVAFYSPLLPSLDTITHEIWEWQQQFDGRASIPGVINHLKNEISEFEATEIGSDERDKEFADLYILLMHLAALSNIDVRSAVANKLETVRKRDYSAQPDAQGCITHKK